jgi:monothiol glutaredoxin
MVEADQVVLFMKGSRSMPQCGFSATVVQILDTLVDSYQTVNVLADPDVREGIKVYSNWPTIPQLYIGGEFIGGCDIVKDMYRAGDLQKKLGVSLEEVEPPVITVTPSAAGALGQAAADNGEAAPFLHLNINASFRAELQFGPDDPQKLHTESNGVTVLTDRGTAKRAEGLIIDFVEGPNGAGFRLENPNEPKPVHAMDVKTLKAKLDAGESFMLIDVRGEDERAIAKIDGARMLDEALLKELSQAERSMQLVFHCHHGGRSQQAAEKFRSQGFTDIHNVTGGIDAWALEIDTDLTRY